MTEVFYGAKALKTLMLTKQQARHLVMSLEASGKGFNIGQLRKLNSILDQLSNPIAEFGMEIDRIARTIKDGVERDELLDRLTNTDGQDMMNLEFEDADYDLLKAEWSGLQFSSNKFARAIVLGIDDAMQVTEAETRPPISSSRQGLQQIGTED